MLQRQGLGLMCWRIKGSVFDLLYHGYGQLKLVFFVYCYYREPNYSVFCRLRQQYSLVLFFDLLDLIDLFCDHFDSLRGRLGFDAGGFGRHFSLFDRCFFFNDRCL